MTKETKDDTGEHLRGKGEIVLVENAVANAPNEAQMNHENEDEFITREKRFPEDYEECPNCAEGDNRWVYECDNCGFIGCYDGVFENGCYVGDPDDRACPECEWKERIRLGRVGTGSVEES